jgi:heat-inducible transcriptional repressor
MADLEELGLLEQPHTSAGRVPSDAGYRYYVDHILEELPVPEAQARLVGQVLAAKMRQVESLVQATVKVLADTSSLISIVLGPQIAPASLVHIGVASAGNGRALLVLVSDAGFVETKVVDAPPLLDAESLQRMGELLNGVIRGQTWQGLSRPGVLRDLRSELAGYEAMLDDTIEFLRASLQPGTSDRVYVSGMSRLLDLPEFRDIERTKTILRLLDREKVVSDILLESLDAGGVTVTIGRENRLSEMAECSLVAAPYHSGTSVIGGVAVLGPTRMDYGLILSLVELVATNLDELLARQA